LKFAAPELDETTIAGVVDVLRSGQLTSGPWVQAFERELSNFCAGRPVRTLTSATAAIEVAGDARLIAEHKPIVGGATDQALHR